jgi:hypothetical protein
MILLLVLLYIYGIYVNRYSGILEDYDILFKVFLLFYLVNTDKLQNEIMFHKEKEKLLKLNNYYSKAFKFYIVVQIMYLLLFRWY